MLGRLIINLTPRAVGGVQTLQDRRAGTTLQMAGLHIQQPLQFQSKQEFRAALRNAVKSGNAEGLLAVLTSPEVCLFLQCGTINAGSVCLHLILKLLCGEVEGGVPGRETCKRSNVRIE